MRPLRNVTPLVLPLTALAVLGGGCVLGPPAKESPDPPTVTGDQPAIGRRLDLEVTGAAGETTRLSGVPGRVTVLCVFTDPAALEPCRAALERYRDRVAVAGIATAEQLPASVAPFRIFRDPGGKALSTGLELGPGQHVLVIDRQGRVRAVVPPDDGAAVLERIGQHAG